MYPELNFPRTAISASFRWGGGFNRKQLVHTYEDIISLNNLIAAWEEFVIGKKNKLDVQEFAYRLMDNIISLHEDLKHKTYQHGGYIHFVISDPKRRDIHKASVRDRLLHHAVYRILYPFFDRTFIADSYSCRVDKGVHRALDRFRDYAYKVSRNHTRTCWVLKCDIRKFFANIDHGILMRILREYIPDRDILRLLGNVIDSFSTFVIPTEATRSERSGGIPPLAVQLGRDDKKQPPHIGLPLGNLTSQLLTNIYMNVFDQWVKHTLKAKYYIRYADDFVFLSDDRQHLVQLVPIVRDFLSRKLRLTLHPNKVSIQTVASGVDFLGWVHALDHRVLRQVTKRRMFKRVEEYMEEESLQSYLGLLSHGNTTHPRRQVMTWYWLCQG